MNTNNLTIKAQEILQSAVAYAASNGNQSVEPSHILKSMLNQEDSLAAYLLTKIGANVSRIENSLNLFVNQESKVSGGEQYLSKESIALLQKAMDETKQFNDKYVSVEHILLALVKSGGKVGQLLKNEGVTYNNLIEAIKSVRQGANIDSQTSEQTFDTLGKYAINLNDSVKKGKLDPVIGRDEEIRRTLQILSRRTKNNPILVGEPGVGKTAIVEGIAHRIVNRDVPENLKNKVVYSLDMGALVAGAKYKGEFEERLKGVVKEVVASNGEVLLFIDEIHTLIGAGKGEGAMDAANILKPALARGELRAIGATTLDEYQKYFEKDKALERRFQKVTVDEPSKEDAISILRGVKERYESHHHIRIRDEAIISAVELSSRYITSRFLPDKAIDLIDEAAAKMRLEMDSVPQEIDELDRKVRQLEIEREAIRREGDDQKVEQLTKMIDDFNATRTEMRAKWQKEKDILDKIQQERNLIEQYKTEAATAERNYDYGKVAELRYGKIREAELEIDKLNEQLHENTKAGGMIREEITSEDIAEIVSRWTGIPVSRMVESEKQKLLHMEDELHKMVVGQQNAITAISNAVRRSRAGLQDPRRPIGSFIFLGTTGVGKTELAKALAAFLFNDENMMTRIDMSEYQERHAVSRLIGAPPGYVGYDEGGQLTEAVRRKPYSVVLLDEIEKAHPDVFNILLQVLDDGRLTDNKGRVVDFKNTIIIMTSNIGSHIIMERFADLDKKSDRAQIIASTEQEVLELMKKSIRPEFLNRIDEIVMFTPLTHEEVREIVLLQLNHLQKMLMDNDVRIELSNEAIDYLTDKGFDPMFGARPVKRAIQRELTNELSKSLLEGNIDRDRPIRITVSDGALKFEN